jgi:uncharacterized lipoprotein YajG
MFANKSTALVLLASMLVLTGCAFEVGSTRFPEPTTEPDATPEMDIEIRLTSDSNSQAEGENMEEFAARIAARDLSYSHPVLVVLTQVISREMLSLGVSSDSWDVQKCWLFETDSHRECADDDRESYFRDQATTKIFLAFASSDSKKALFLVECRRYWNDRRVTDYYRLVLELNDGKWVKRSILPMFW